MSRALAHFEPGAFAINLTRYQKKGGSKHHRMLNSGGVGSLSHEWAHALDFWLGQKHDRTKDNFLSGGRSTRYRVKESNLKLKGPKPIMERLIGKLLTDGKGGKSAYRKKMEELVKKNGLGNYWLWRHEVFARTFEAWVAMKLKEKGISNVFLSKSKYEHRFYPSEKMLRKINPEMRKVVSFLP